MERRLSSPPSSNDARVSSGNNNFPTSSSQNNNLHDTFNDSVFSDIKNDLDSARKLPMSDQKERMLSDIQSKITELVSCKQEDYTKMQEIMNENYRMREQMMQ